MPPSMSTLEARLRGRKTDSDDVIARRMAAARHELSHFGSFDFAIVNDDFERAYASLQAVYRAMRLQVSYQRPQLEALLRS